MGEHAFDFRGLTDELRCHSTEWLWARRSALVCEQRRLRVEELAVTAVLDDRGVLGDAVAAADGVSVRAVRETLETARALEGLPRVAAVAAAGGLSTEQLVSVARLADAGSDAEWARRAPLTAPEDLARIARTQVTPTAADGRARRAARDLSWWWRKDTGMLAFRGELPDVDGALVESVFTQMIEKMRPVKGQPWETRGRRGADALVELCRNYAHVEAVSGPTPHLVVQVPVSGPAEIAGIPLPDSMVEALRASAKIEAVLVDLDGVPIAIGRNTAVVSPKVKRAVLLRDGHCRWPGCTRRYGLEVHHLWPVSWGGTDEQSNLAAVCAGGTDHHPLLVPQGPYLLLGNPNRPDGLTLVHRDELAQLADQPDRAPPHRHTP